MYNHCEDKFHKVPPLFEKLPKEKVFIRGYYLRKYSLHNKIGVVKMSVLIGLKLTNFKDEDKAEARKKSDTIVISPLIS